MEHPTARHPNSLGKRTGAFRPLHHSPRNSTWLDLEISCNCGRPLLSLALGLGLRAPLSFSSLELRRQQHMKLCTDVGSGLPSVGHVCERQGARDTGLACLGQEPIHHHGRVSKTHTMFQECLRQGCLGLRILLVFLTSGCTVRSREPVRLINPCLHGPTMALAMH